MSSFTQRNLEAKHEKIVKELSRVAANRRCIDCDNMASDCVKVCSDHDLLTHFNPFPTLQGPQYVITNYGIFVCTACGGIQ